MMSKRVGRWIGLALFGLLLALPGCDEKEEAPAEDPGFVFVNPLLDVRPGEWVRYQMQGGQIQTITVLQVNPGQRTVYLEERYRDPEENRTVSDDRYWRPQNHFLYGFQSAGCVVQKLYPEEITVAGRKFSCLCVEYEGRIPGRFRTWYTPEIPVLGMVRQVKIEGDHEVVNAELIEWSE